MRLLKIELLFIVASLCLSACFVKSPQVKQRKVWSSEEANTWYKQQRWLVGANFLPSTASNQIEMWQAETFDSVTIDRELGWAESLGMNTSRVFLHDLLHQQDSVGFYSRINTFLNIAKKHHIKPLFVFFDSCWDPFPHLGAQRAPKAFVHNSGWLQSPGYYALKDSTQNLRLQKYVTGVVTKFGKDERILGWDIWNEPDNLTGPSYEKVDLPGKVGYVLPLLKKAFTWARNGNPSQPLTSGIWLGDWSVPEKMKPIEQLQIAESDVISFHNYDKPEEFQKRIELLQRYNKPILCTEYMARPNGSTFMGFLPIAKKYNVGMFNWGFVNGKSQTIYPWDSWTKQYQAEPALWFHDIFRKDGTPYKVEETDFIHRILSTSEKVK
jgi:hypothetical protein